MSSFWDSQLFRPKNKNAKVIFVGKKSMLYLHILTAVTAYIRTCIENFVTAVKYRPPLYLSVNYHTIFRILRCFYIFILTTFMNHDVYR